MPPPNTPANTPVLTVSSLNRLVRECLESSFPLTWVGGEVSNLTYAASGHVYFSLKDANVQVRCVMWRSRAQILGWRLENGQKVEARALVSFYEPRGEFQLNVEAIRRAGQGDLFERFLRLKEQLEKEGLFAAERKRPIPAFPRSLGIVSSLQAAALRDVLTTLHRRAPHLRLSLYPTPVQGEGAGTKIADAIARAAREGHDAIIVCRGGGSIEDLWAFNEESVARAIAASPTPVVSGVGHETDFTIADFAADLRAPTPTAAAELASPDRDSLLAALEQRALQLARHLQRNLGDRQQRLDGLAARLVHPAERLSQKQREIAKLHARLQQSAERQLDHARLQLRALARRQAGAIPQPARQLGLLEQLRRRFVASGRWQISQQNGKLNALAGSLSQLDPLAVLSRGYALAIGPDGRAVRDATTLRPDDPLHITFGRGSATATVNRVVPAPEAD